MKLCRFEHQDFFAPHYGILEGEYVQPLIDADAFGSRTRARTDKLPLSSVRIIAPVSPSKIVCVGRNYREHAEELGNRMPTEPLLFLKAPSAIIASGETIQLPPESAQVELEGELGVVIGRRACRIPEHEDPLSYVLGYTCVNDVTARDLQRRDVQFTRAKSFDTFCPVGPFISTDLNPLDVQVTARLNGDFGDGFQRPLPAALHLLCHDLTTGRPHSHRHSRRSLSDEGRRHRGGRDSRHRHSAQRGFREGVRE
jgi:2-keto-4-pentenoate hydratase/2-oxohepta-3-ene-1,7-dioic acid hydratase in catechol pathway